jgi:hypothetical protein
MDPKPRTELARPISILPKRLKRLLSQLQTVGSSTNKQFTRIYRLGDSRCLMLAVD